VVFWCFMAAAIDIPARYFAYYYWYLEDVGELL
jgi:hypothetical protein